MGNSTDGMLCYGVKAEEGYEFPWDEWSEEDNDLVYEDPEHWWLDVTGFHQKHLETLKNQGHDAWFEKMQEHKKSLPFELVNYCSMDCPAYIVAAKGSVITANRGYPVELDIEEIARTKDEIDMGLNEEVVMLGKFVKEYLGDVDVDMTFHLCSYAEHV